MAINGPMTDRSVRFLVAAAALSCYVVFALWAAAPQTTAVSPALPADLTLDGDSGTIAGTPQGPSPKAPHKFTVTDSATPPVSVSAELAFEVKEKAQKTTA